MTLYLANPCTGGPILDAMRDGLLGFIDTPAQGNARPESVTWCADNGCYGSGYPGDDEWLSWLEGQSFGIGNCLFATAPDVVGDAARTLARSGPYLPIIRDLGYPAALVAQDGLERLDVPWDSFDALFIGGSTEWKMGGHARELVAEARMRGKWVHFGRVNSYLRYSYAHAIGCDSVDGTYLTYGPSVNLPRLLSWVSRIREMQPTLF